MLGIVESLFCVTFVFLSFSCFILALIVEYSGSPRRGRIVLMGLLLILGCPFAVVYYPVKRIVRWRKKSKKSETVRPDVDAGDAGDAHVEEEEVVVEIGADSFAPSAQYQARCNTSKLTLDWPTHVEQPDVKQISQDPPAFEVSAIVHPVPASKSVHFDNA